MARFKSHLKLAASLATIASLVIACVALWHQLEWDQEGSADPPPALEAAPQPRNSPNAEAQGDPHPSLRVEASKPESTPEPIAPPYSTHTSYEEIPPAHEPRLPEDAAVLTLPASSTTVATPEVETPAARHWQVTLHEGEQEVFAEGRITLEIDLSRIGTMNVGTLRIYTRQSTRNEPLLDSGGRFEIVDGDDHYVISVSKPDFEQRFAVLRIDPSTP